MESKETDQTVSQLTTEAHNHVHKEQSYTALKVCQQSHAYAQHACMSPGAAFPHKQICGAPG